MKKSNSWNKMWFWHSWTRKGKKSWSGYPDREKTECRTGGPINSHSQSCKLTPQRKNKCSSPWQQHYSYFSQNFMSPMIWPCLICHNQDKLATKTAWSNAKPWLWFMARIPRCQTDDYLQYFCCPWVSPSHCLRGRLPGVWPALHRVTSICEVKETNTTLTSSTESRNIVASPASCAMTSVIWHKPLVFNVFLVSVPSPLLQSHVPWLLALKGLNWYTNPETSQRSDNKIRKTS